MTSGSRGTGGPAVVTRAGFVLLVHFVLCGAPLVSAQPSPPRGTPPFTLPDVTVDEAVLAEVDDYLARNREEHGWPGLAAALVARPADVLA